MTKPNVTKDLNKSKKSAVLIFVFLASVVALVATFTQSPKITKSPKDDSTSSQIGKIIENKNLKEFTKITDELGPQQTYQLLKKHFPNNDAAAHDFAHIIGIVAHDQKGISNLKICDTGYNYGCYHGFIEAFIAKNTVAQVAQIEDGCLALGPVHAPSCLHGIGHGVMVDSSYKLDKALENCASLAQTSQIYCWDGVFMERIVGSMLTTEDKLVMTRQTLREPCDSVATVYKEQCWRNQVSAWLPFFQGNTKDVGNQCSLIDAIYQKTCFESLGLLVTITSGENAGQIVSACTAQNGQTSDDCLIGAMKELLFEGKNPVVAQTLCATVSPPNQQSCQQIYADHRAQSQARFGK